MEPLKIEITHDQLTVHIISENYNLSISKAVERPSVHPIVKWAGGKRWLGSIAKQLAPADWDGRYYEPFTGGASFFFGLQPRRAMLSDSNEELINTYRTIREDPEGVIRLLRTYPYDKQFYYKIRNKVPRSPRSAAARLLYLNHTCWNGLYRVNQEGKFNTPFGRLDNPTICDESRIRAAAKLLRRAQLRNGDFAEFVSKALPGDFVYIDPPYITGHQNNGFLRYNRRLFSWADQERLAELARHLSKTGVQVLVSNADHTSVVQLYKEFFYYKATRHSLISGQVRYRGLATEALLSNYPLLGCESEVI